MAERANGHDQPSLFEEWLRVKDIDPDEGRRLLHELMGLRTVPKPEDPYAIMTPPRSPGAGTRRQRARRM
jgi:hypothetical protein